MIRSRTSVAVFALALLLGALLAPVARADDAPATMLLIDGSGSMWGRLDPDKRAKIDIIRERLATKLQSAGASRVGLASFGHRRKGDCSDVEIIAPIDAPRDAVLGPLAKLSPRGKGPLVAALREAVNAVGSARPATIFVINDGVDNCQQDACAAAAEIATGHPGLAIHMISIGIDPAEVPRLSCVSKATGGQFFDVKDSDGLLAAIDEATKLTMLEPASAAGKPLPPAAAKPPPAGATLRATVALAPGGSAVTAPVHWKLFKSGEAAELSESDAHDFTGTLDPGRYELEARVGRMTIRQRLTIEPGNPISVIVPLNAAHLKVRVAATATGDASASAVIGIAPAGGETANQDANQIGNAGTADVILPPGTYAVSVIDGSVRQTKSVTLAAGAEQTLDMLLGTGRLEVSAAQREDGGAIDDVIYTVSEDDPDSPDGRRDVARSRAPTATFVLPAGTYYVSARSGDSEARQRIAVGAGDTVKRALIFPLAPLTVSATIAGHAATADDGLVFKVAALDGEQREVTRSVLPKLSLSLPPGKYKITANLNAHNLTATRDVTLEAGKPESVVVAIDAADVTFKAPGNSTSLMDQYWDVLDAKGLPVVRTTGSAPQVLLQPGRYTVRLEARDRRNEAAFEVRGGEKRVIELGAN